MWLKHIVKIQKYNTFSSVITFFEDISLFETIKEKKKKELQRKENLRNLNKNNFSHIPKVLFAINKYIKMQIKKKKNILTSEIS